MNIKTLIILIVVGVAGYFAYMKFVDPDKLKQGVQSAAPDHYVKGEAAFTGGLWQQVVDSYTAALKEKPDDPRATEAEYRIAKGLQQLRRDSEALAAYRAFLAKHPDHPDKQIVRGHIERYEAMNVK